MPFTPATLNLHSLLTLAFQERLGLFVARQLGDGWIRVTPRVEVLGLGGRVVEPGLLPEGAVNDDYLELQIEPDEDPRYRCRFTSLHCRTVGGREPLTLKVGSHWPMRHGGVLQAALRRCCHDLIASALQTRRGLEPARGHGLVGGIRTAQPGEEQHP